ncbi:hypothetical protein Cgig2_021346 [Carnegiea gigantea]|uniref:Uncharacterized protein n=1 Tax=Carnegiea gigantea TaxID=171969 RepID=A0A9Q1JYB1_9CARY|nr:hypothetical protein Cgig2_021346 [Carnegiea gigantea]
MWERLEELLQGLVAQELVSPFRQGLLQMGSEFLTKFHTPLLLLSLLLRNITERSLTVLSLSSHLLGGRQLAGAKVLAAIEWLGEVGLLVAAVTVPSSCSMSSLIVRGNDSGPAQVCGGVLLVVEPVERQRRCLAGPIGTVALGNFEGPDFVLLTAVLRLSVTGFCLNPSISTVDVPLHTLSESLHRSAVAVGGSAIQVLHSDQRSPRNFLGLEVGFGIPDSILGYPSLSLLTPYSPPHPKHLPPPL